MVNKGLSRLSKMAKSAYELGAPAREQAREDKATQDHAKKAKPKPEAPPTPEPNRGQLGFKMPPKSEPEPSEPNASEDTGEE